MFSVLRSFAYYPGKCKTQIWPYGFLLIVLTNCGALLGSDAREYPKSTSCGWIKFLDDGMRRSADFNCGEAIAGSDLAQHAVHVILYGLFG